MNFQHYRDLWSVHFIEADRKTLIRNRTRYYHFATLHGLRAFAEQCRPENTQEFERSAIAWSSGSNYVNLTD
jgi:hypothetical protein